MPPITLSPRQREVLQALADAKPGTNRKTIAAALRVSVRTFTVHYYNARLRLGIPDGVNAIQETLTAAGISPTPKTQEP